MFREHVPAPIRRVPQQPNNRTIHHQRWAVRFCGSMARVCWVVVWGGVCVGCVRGGGGRYGVGVKSTYRGCGVQYICIIPDVCMMLYIYIYIYVYTTYIVRIQCIQYIQHIYTYPFDVLYKYNVYILLYHNTYMYVMEHTLYWHSRSGGRAGRLVQPMFSSRLQHVEKNNNIYIYIYIYIYICIFIYFCLIFIGGPQVGRVQLS